MKNKAQSGRRPASIPPPPMVKAGHAANRLSDEQLNRLVDWLKTLQRPGGPSGPKRSQKAIGELTGVSQPFIHNLMGKKGTTTIGTVRSMMLKAGANPTLVLGTVGALGRYEGKDMESGTRGQVLDALSAFYDEDFLMTCQNLTPPAGSERWTHHRWNRYIVELRDMWESGHLKPKRTPPHNR